MFDLFGVLAEREGGAAEAASALEALLIHERLALGSSRDAPRRAL